MSGFIQSGRFTIPGPAIPGAVSDASISALSPSGWFDFADTSTLWQDTAGTVPVTADGDPIGRVDDKSGNGKNLLQATAGRRPLWKTSGGRSWADFDGSDDCLLTGTLSPTYAQPNVVALAGKFDALTSDQNLFDSSLNHRHAVYLLDFDNSLRMNGGSAAVNVGAMSTSPFIVSAIFDGASSYARVNGVNSSTGNPGSDFMDQFTLGCYIPTFASLDGRIYEVIIRDTLFTGGDITTVDNRLANKAGVAI